MTHIYNVVIENRSESIVLLKDIWSVDPYYFPDEILLCSNNTHIIGYTERGKEMHDIDYMFPESLTISIDGIDIPVMKNGDNTDWNLCRKQNYIRKPVKKQPVTEYFFTFTNKIVRDLLDAAKEEQFEQQ